MALIKKNDVKNYLAVRKRNGFRPYRPASQLDATGVSGKPFADADSKTTEASENTFSQPVPSDVESPNNKTRTDSGQVAKPEASKGARA